MSLQFVSVFSHLLLWVSCSLLPVLIQSEILASPYPTWAQYSKDVSAFFTCFWLHDVHEILIGELISRSTPKSIVVLMIRICFNHQLIYHIPKKVPNIFHESVSSLTSLQSWHLNNSDNRTSVQNFLQVCSSSVSPIISVAAVIDLVMDDSQLGSSGNVAIVHPALVEFGSRTPWNLPTKPSFFLKNNYCALGTKR